MNELRDQLWDFVYGLLDEADAIELRERITSDRQVAREYARVKLQSELLAQAARGNSAERELPTLPERPSRVAASRLSGARLVVFGGSLALSLSLLLFAGVTYWVDGTPLHGPAVAQALENFEKNQHPRMVVVGPQVLQANDVATYEITTQTLDGEALSTPLQASLEDADGNRLWYESLQTGTNGKQTLALPADKVRGDAVRLKIEAEASGKSDPAADNGAVLDTWLPIQERSGELSVVNEVSDGVRRYIREAEIRSLDRSDLSDNVDKLAESSRREILQRSKKSQGEDSVALSDEAQRVRWGTARFAAPSLGLRDESASAEKLAELESKAGDVAKQHETLPGGSRPLRSPAATGRPGDDSRQDPYYNHPEAKPRAAPSPPAAPPEPSSDKKEKNLPAQQPETPRDDPAPATAPVTTSNPAPATTSSQPVDSAAAEEDIPALSKSKGQKVLLESVTANEKVVASRMIDGTEAVPSLQQRIDDLRKSGKIDAKFSGRIERKLYDAAVAPPQKVAEMSLDIPPDVEPLVCSIRFDRPEYRAGDFVTAELKVTDANSRPLPAVLNVQVDAVPLSRSDAEQPTTPHYLFTYAEAPPTPLVFDNATRQAQDYQQALAHRLTEQRQSQRRTALLLLAGSGLGVGLLMVGGTLRWLPKARYWLPVAGLLAVSGMLGVIWLPREQSLPATPAIIPATPLITSGVQSHQPLAEYSERGSQPKPIELELLRDRGEDDLVATNESRLPNIAPDADADRKATTFSLFAMADWERLAQSGEGLELALDQVAKPESFRAEFGFNNFSYSPTSDWAAPSAPPERQDFADTSAEGAQNQTVLWHPRLTTDSAGICRIEFPAPAGPLAHRFVVTAHSAGRLGTAQKLIPTIVEVPRP